MKAFINWSGGKDAALALHRCLQTKDFHVGALLTNRVAGSNRVSMHGVRWELIEIQAASIGLPIKAATLAEEPGGDEYEAEVARQVLELKAYGFATAVFGDIFLEDLRDYRETQMSKLGVHSCFPLWQEKSRSLMKEFISLGFKAVVVCVNASKLHPSFCGRIIDHQFISDLPADVDVCGENGEFHSFVFDGPIFRQPVKYEVGGRSVRSFASPQAPQNSSSVAKEVSFIYTDLLPAI